MERMNCRSLAPAGLDRPPRSARTHIESGTSGHESPALHPPRHPGRSHHRRPARPDRRARAGRGAGRGRGAEFLRPADHRRQIPVQAGVPVLAGGGVRRHRRKRRRRRHRLCRRRPRHRLCGWGAAREKLAIGADKLVKMPGRPRLRPRRRPDRHLRHLLLRAEGPRRLEARRDAGGARRLGRHRPRRGRARQADGRARDRLRLVRRQARLRQAARRRRRRQLRQRAICATG